MLVFAVMFGSLLFPTSDTNSWKNFAYGQNEIIVDGYLNIYHGHLEDGIPLYEFHLFDFDTFRRPTIILEFENNISIKEVFGMAGQEVRVKGTITETSTDPPFQRMKVVSIKPIGATVELDQKVYTWTDKVFITIVAPHFNLDPQVKEVIGGPLSPVKVSTKGHDLDNYMLVESGTDTGIFLGTVILTGFTHDADGDSKTGDGHGNDTKPATTGIGPTGGFIEAGNDDGITVSFESSVDETVIGSAAILWSMGEAEWIFHSVVKNGKGFVRVTDPDMNLNPEEIDSFKVNVRSNSDVKGIKITVKETDKATGIFEGTVFFGDISESSSHKLKVSDFDTVTLEYDDNTRPGVYSIEDELGLTDTASIRPPLTLQEYPDHSNIDDNIIRVVYQESDDSFDIYRIIHGLPHDDSSFDLTRARIDPDGIGAPSEFTSRTVPINFSNLRHESKASEYFQEIFYDSGDSLSSYFESNSYGKFNLQGRTLEWKTLEYPKERYTSSSGNLRPYALIEDAMPQIVNNINFNGPDGRLQNSSPDQLRGDGDKGDDIDQLIFIVTQDNPEQDSYLKPQASSYLQPHNTGTAEDEHWVFLVFIVDGGSGFPVGETYQKGYGAVAHELGHNFNWYHTPMLRPHDTYSDPWSLLSGNNDETSPPGVVSFQRKRAHWIHSEDVVQVQQGQSKMVTLDFLNNPSTLEPNRYLMAEVPFGSDDIFYTVEARKDSRFDHIPKPTGLMIYQFNPDGYGDNIMRNIEEDKNAPLSVVPANPIVCRERNNDGFCIDADYNALSVNLGQTYNDSDNNIKIKLVSESEDSMNVCISNDGDPAVPKILINPSNTRINDSMNIVIEFRDCFDDLIQDVRYSLSVRQNGISLLQVNNESDPDGEVTHHTYPLPFSPSSSKPVYVNAEFHSSNDFTQTIVTENIRVVPEFDAVAIVVLLISIIAVIALTSKSKVSIVGIYK